MGCNYEEKKNVLSSVTWCHNFLADPIGITRIFKLIKSKSEHRPTFVSRNAATGRGSHYSNHSHCPQSSSEARQKILTPPGLEPGPPCMLTT